MLKRLSLKISSIISQRNSYLRRRFMRPIPDKNIQLMIVGAQKAGTTSLKQYLGEHPAMHAHKQKEFGYFIDPIEYEKGLDVALEKYFHFAGEQQIRVAKNAQLYANQQGLQRLKAHNPNCKIILVLRNPVERTYSGFLMERNYGSVNCSFDEIINLMHKPSPIEVDWRYEVFIGMSQYQKHIQNLWQLFGKDQVHIVLFEELKNNPQQVCKQIFEWIGVDATFHPQTHLRYNETQKIYSKNYARLMGKILHNQNPIKRFARKLIPKNADYRMGELLRNVNKSKHKHPELSERAKKQLIDYFRPYNEELSKILNRDLSHWNN